MSLKFSELFVRRASSATLVFLLAATSLLSTSCAGGADAVTGPGGGGGGNGGSTGTPARLDLSTSSVSLSSVGASENVNAQVRDAAGNLVAGASVTWSSADITVADVAGVGTTAVITARAPGRTTIRAQIGSFVQDIAVNVAAIRTLTISPANAQVRAGDTYTFSTSLDADADARTELRWQSDNPAVASVSPQGVVTAIAPGTSLIRVNAIGDPRVVAMAQLTVTTARSVAILGAPANLWVGDDTQLQSLVDVDSTQSRAVTWSTSDASVLSVSSNGRLVAYGIGTATVRLTSAADISVRDSAIVRVGPARIVTVSPASTQLVAGETRVLSAQVQIEDGLSTAVTWRSSNSSVAMVASNGMVTGISQGTTTITAIAVADTTRRGTATVVISGAVRDLSVTPSVVSLFLGDAQQLAASISADPGIPTTTIWRSSNAAVASVSEDGTVTGVSVGSAIVTAMAAADTTKRATALITVRYAPVVTMTPASAFLELGQSRQFAANVQADASVSTAVTWRSSNPAVATVSTSGLVTGVAMGTATIIATSVADETRSASAVVTVAPAVRSVLLSPSTLTLAPQATEFLTATVLGDAGVPTGVLWRTSNSSIATVSSSGAVTGVAAGTATITALSSADTTKRATSSITVRVPPQVSVSPATMALDLHQTVDIVATVVAGAGVSNAVTWRSSNASIASVNANGRVTAVGFGTTLVTAVSVADTTRRASATITVVPRVQSVSLSPSSLSVSPGASATLTATVSADPGANTSVFWRSNNTAIASVSSSGVVTGMANGTTTVTALSMIDTTKRATATVEVVNGVVVNLTPASVTLNVNEQHVLAVSVQADAGQSTAVTWRSSAPSIATVSGNGTVTALAVGTAVISAVSVQDTLRRASSTITVAPRVLGVSLNTTSATLTTGETEQFSASVSADPGANTSVIWRSSQPAIASVSSNGLVTAMSAGSVTITAVSVGDTTRRASASVTVLSPVGVSVSPSSATMALNDQRTLVASVQASGGQSTAVTWRTSNASVATVSSGGVVTATGFGSASITAVSVADTTRRASAAITVNPQVMSVSVSPSTASLNTGQSVQLQPTVNAQGSLSTAVTFVSSNPGVASVNFSGMVSAIGQGNATITVRSVADTSKTATAAIAVSAPATRLAASWSSARLGGALHEDVIAIKVIDASNAFAVNSLGNVYRYSGGTWTLSTSGSAFSTQFLGISATTTGNVMAVGTGGVIARFNGSGWSTMSSGTNRTLNAVWLESTTSGFAVGANGTALRWNGSSWSSTSTGINQSLNDVWSVGGQAWAVGEGGGVVAWNGSSWSSQSTPTNETLYGVSGSSTSNVVAVGTSGAVVRWNGSSWSTVNSGTTSDFYDVAGNSANGGRMYLASDAGLMQLNGSTVSSVSTPYAPRLFAAGVDASGNAWTTGQRGSVMRYTGSAWETLNLAPDLIDVWTTATNNAWAVGEFGAVYRWNGGSWSRQTTPTTASLNTVWAPSASEAFAGGDNGTMLRWNGSSWSSMSFAGSGHVYSLWGTSGSNVYATTSAGQVVRYNGSSWSVVYTSTQPLWSVHGASASDVFASGENGIAVRFNGTSWSAVSAPTTGTLAGVFATGNGAMAVGANTQGTSGIAYGYTGSWSTQSTGTGAVLTSVWGPAVNDVYATGDQGTILRWNGSSWSSMSSGTTDMLWSVSGAPAGNGGGFAVGYNSTVATATSGAAFMASARLEGGVRGSLEPAPGARLVRGALPSGAARAARKK
ncbi:MAG: Ig-like domain-containing protein [Gemmatimonadaceae bacterium]|nr:Ig-like domain-containing protein [Gemmatimonadaceae bacterium]